MRCHIIYLRRPRDLRARFKLGENICEDPLAGYIHDLEAPPCAPEEVCFAGSGVALCIRTLSHDLPEITWGI